MITTMKKDYIKPQATVIEVEAEALLAGSPVDVYGDYPGSIGVPRRRRRVLDDLEWLELEEDI